MVSKRGKLITAEGTTRWQNSGVQDSYKHLGIPQAKGNHEEAAWKAITAKYLQRVQQILKSQINGRNMVQPINTYAQPVIRYPTGIINWPKKIEAADFTSNEAPICA